MYAGLISYRKAHQRLGIPGVRVVHVPIYDSDGHVAATNSIDLPERILNFSSETKPVEKEVLDWLPKDTTYGQRVYKSEDGLRISTMVVLMGADRTSIHKPEYCLRGTGWTIDKDEFDQVRVPALDLDMPVRKMTIRRIAKLPDGQKVDVRGFYVFWFVSKDQVTADHNKRMWSMGLDIIRTGVLTRWAYVACHVTCAPGKEAETYIRLKEFIASAAPGIHERPANIPRLAQGN